MKKLSLFFFLVAILHLGAILKASESSSGGRRAPTPSPQISPRERLIFTPSSLPSSPMMQSITKKPISISIPKPLDVRSFNSCSDEIDDPELSSPIIMSPPDLKSLLKSHAKKISDASPSSLKQSNSHGWMDCAEISLISSAAAGACYATYKQSGVILKAHKLLQPQKRFIPGTESAAIGSAQLLYAGISSATALIAFSAIAYKINRMIHASCRYKLEKQDKAFADQVEELSADVQAYQTATDQVCNTLSDRVNKMEKSNRRLAMQTQEGFTLQTQHIDSASRATACAYEALRLLATAQQSQAAPMLPSALNTALDQAKAAVEQIAQEQLRQATPVIDIAPEATPMPEIQPTQIKKPKKIKSTGGCFCC